MIISFSLCFFIIKQPFNLQGLDIILLIFSASFMAEMLFLAHMAAVKNTKPYLKKNVVIYFFGFAPALYLFLLFWEKNIDYIQYFLIFGASGFLALLFSGSLKNIADR